MQDKLSSAAKEYWAQYLNSIPQQTRPQNPFVEAAYAGTKDTTDELIALFLTGRKTAGSSLVIDYELNDEPLPVIGNFWIILNSISEPKLIVKTVGVERNLFKEIPQRVVIAEGEGDLSVEYWKQVHSQFFLPFLEEWGVENLEEAEVITEYFEIVYK